jgi:class 3 adenylate cyclase
VRDLPSGTVTLLFTDIERSTQLMRQLGESWAEAHADHRSLLREAVGGAGGREVDTQGDAFFAVFARARDALGAAAAAQSSFHRHPWPEGTELRVRMGIHTGEPTLGEEGYLGLDVVRGARICGAAHGGQVLVSETTRTLVRGDEPADVELRDLGDHHLKDLAHPERLYQLVAPGLPSQFAAPRSLDTETAPTVPVPALGLATRERELAQQAVAAVRDLENLGPSIERRVEETLRAVGITTAAPPPGRRPRLPAWAIVAIVSVAVVAAAVVAVVWLLLRIV